jgi:hypothetical protein
VQYREQPPQRRYFLLACWEERGDQQPGVVRWRFSLQDPRTGHRWAFPDLEALLAGLDGQLGSAEPGSDKEERSLRQGSSPGCGENADV